MSVRNLTSRIGRIEQQLIRTGATRCPLCLDGGAWRMRFNGQRQLHDKDPVYDETWHCRRCGREAPENTCRDATWRGETCAEGLIKSSGD